MNDQELIDWIKGLKNNDNVPKDTNQRMTRLIQMLVNKAYPVKGKPGRPKLHLNKTA